MSQRKANDSSDKKVDEAAHKLEDVLSIGARAKTTWKKSALQGAKQKQAVKELEKVGLVDKKDDSDAKADMEDPAVQFLMQMQLSDDMAAKLIIDNAEFREVFLPAPVNETTAQISVWIGIVRCLEGLQFVDGALAAQFYDAANDHMFYAALMDEIEDDEPQVQAQSVPATSTMDTASSIGAPLSKPKAGERYKSEFSELKALATELTKNLREITQKIPEYYNNVKNAVAQTKQTYNDYGLATASKEAAKGAGRAGWNAIKKIWKALRNMNLSDLVPLIVDIVLPLLARLAPVGASLPQGAAERATVEALTKQYENSKAFFTGPTGKRVFSTVGAINQATGGPLNFMNDGMGNPVSSYEDLSENNMLELGVAFYNYPSLVRGGASLATGGMVAPPKGILSVGDGRYTQTKELWKSLMAVAVPGASVPFALTMLLFQIITSAVTSLAAISNKRIAKWAKLNGNKLRIEMNSVLKPHLDYTKQYVQTLMGMDAASKRFGRLIRTTLKDQIVDQIGAENKQWRDAARVLETMTKKGNSSTLSWFKSKVFQGLGAARLLDALGLAPNTPLAAISKYNKYLVTLRGAAEVVTYAIWRVRIKYYIDTVGDSVENFKSFYETLKLTIDVNDFNRKMAQQQLKWTLTNDWPLSPRALRAAAAQADNDEDQDEEEQQAQDDEDDDYDEEDWEGAVYVD